MKPECILWFLSIFIRFFLIKIEKTPLHSKSADKADSLHRVIKSLGKTHFVLHYSLGSAKLFPHYADPAANEYHNLNKMIVLMRK